MKIEANGILINYELSGKPDAPVVMLSHSLACSLLMWNPQMEVLEPHFQVLRYDMRGHGADAIGLLDTLKIEVVHFVGLSIGGMIGQCLALNYADRLHSLALCDTAPIIPEEARPLFRERMDRARTGGMEAMVQETLERWFTQPYLKQNPPETELIGHQIATTSLAGYLGCSEAILGLNYVDRLTEIKLPTRIIVGEDDPATTVESSKAIHEHIPHAKLEILPSAAHLSNIEQAEAFNTTLMEFLRDQ
jgi:3-oxoadipate enol-lactonase